MITHKHGLSLRSPSFGPKQSPTSDEIASSQKTLLAMTRLWIGAIIGEAKR
jgi:hypothetical protein